MICRVLLRYKAIRGACRLPTIVVPGTLYRVPGMNDGSIEEVGGVGVPYDQFRERHSLFLLCRASKLSAVARRIVGVLAAQ